VHKPLMPLGVEHVDEALKLAKLFLVHKPLMPLGVEHILP